VKSLWLSKNSFHGISTIKFVCKLLNVRWPQTLKFSEITAWFLFQQPRLVATIMGSSSATRYGQFPLVQGFLDCFRRQPVYKFAIE
jgi:hypothetical protein